MDTTNSYLFYSNSSTINTTRRVVDGVIFATSVNYSKTPLREAILDSTHVELGRTMTYVFAYLTREYQQELLAHAPADTDECTRVLNIWATRLKTIRSALANFPTLMSESGTSPPAHPVITPSSASGNTTQGATTAVQHTGPSSASKTQCLERDKYQCIITGNKFSDGFELDVVPIIPFALANQSGCRDLDIWKMLEMFWGPEVTDELFEGLLHNIYGPENLITLDHSIYSMFSNGSCAFTPVTQSGDRIRIINHHTGDYWLAVYYFHEFGTTEPIQSTKVLETGEMATLHERSRVPITHNEQLLGHSHTRPLHSYFSLRAAILSLKHNLVCYSTSIDSLIPGSTILTPSPVTPVDPSNWSPTHSAGCHLTGDDPVLAASDILQALVDSGALEGS